MNTLSAGDAAAVQWEGRGQRGFLATSVSVSVTAYVSLYLCSTAQLFCMCVFAWQTVSRALFHAVCYANVDGEQQTDRRTGQTARKGVKANRKL